jgi:hypothetical protein
MKTLVKNLEKLKRPIIFDNVGGKCTATDMDFLFEFYNKFLICGEIKEKSKDITVGQKITLTRLVDCWNKVEGNIGIIIFAQHNPDNKIIMLADCIVNKVYINGKWKPIENTTVSEFIQMFAEKYNIKHLKN